jgi:hypothetical protein
MGWSSSIYFLINMGRGFLNASMAYANHGIFRKYKAAKIIFLINMILVSKNTQGMPCGIYMLIQLSYTWLLPAVVPVILSSVPLPYPGDTGLTWTIGTGSCSCSFSHSYDCGIHSMPCHSQAFPFGLGRACLTSQKLYIHIYIYIYIYI